MMSLRLPAMGFLLSALAAFWACAAEAQAPLTPSRQKTPPPAASDAPAASSPSSTTARSAPPDPGEIFRDCAECTELVVVPAGEFKMGSDDVIYEKPVHRVTIPNSFAIGRRETTFEEWDLCVTEGGCKYRPDDRGWGRGTRPVTDISWNDAHEYVAWLSRKTGQKYRLPSEAEWEYATRAGTVTSFWWGPALVKGSANCDDCGDAPLRQTLPTQSYRPNGFGLFDVAGNAAEWVEDCWNDNYRGAPANGSAWTTGQCQQRSLRGGSFSTKSTFLRSAARFRYDQDVRYYANGFRVARDL